MMRNQNQDTFEFSVIENADQPQPKQPTFDEIRISIHQICSKILYSRIKNTAKDESIVSEAKKDLQKQIVRGEIPSKKLRKFFNDYPREAVLGACLEEIENYHPLVSKKRKKSSLRTYEIIAQEMLNRIQSSSLKYIPIPHPPKNKKRRKISSFGITQAAVNSLSEMCANTLSYMLGDEREDETKLNEAKETLKKQIRSGDFFIKNEFLKAYSQQIIFDVCFNAIETYCPRLQKKTKINAEITAQKTSDESTATDLEEILPLPPELEALLENEDFLSDELQTFDNLIPEADLIALMPLEQPSTPSWETFRFFKEVPEVTDQICYGLNEENEPPKLDEKIKY